MTKYDNLLDENLQDKVKICVLNLCNNDRTHV
jgi:hypothetical protein